MPRQLPPDILHLVAYLASQEPPIPQKEIATQLMISPATVHRLIKEAHDNGILKATPTLQLPPERIAEISLRLTSHGELLKDLSSLSRQVVTFLQVVKPAPGQTLREAVAAVAARRIIMDMLPRSSTVAITWGAILRELVRQIEVLRIGHQPLASRSVDFVQVCGDPSGAIADPTLRSSTLVSKLSAAINHSDTSPYTFSVPAAIPARFKGSELNVIRDFIYENGGYAKIFQRDSTLLVSVDHLITSCGNGRAGQDRWLSECAGSAGIHDSELEELTVGNVGGFWLARPNLIKAQRERLDAVNARWTGIRLGDIRSIAIRGGVVLLAIEEHQAEIVLRLVEERLVSRLFLSNRLAERLSEIRR